MDPIVDVVDAEVILAQDDAIESEQIQVISKLSSFAIIVILAHDNLKFHLQFPDHQISKADVIACNVLFIKSLDCFFFGKAPHVFQCLSL